MATIAEKFDGRSEQTIDSVPGAETSAPTKQEVLDELRRILDSPDFDASARNKDFLRFSVNEWIAGRAGRIKAYAIAVEVFNRDDTFDPQTDPIVRIEASRLRRSLERYYMLGGSDDPLRIDIPKGSYAPAFSRQTTPIESSEAAAHAKNGQHTPTEPATRSARSRVFVRLCLAALLIVGVMLVGGYYLFGFDRLEESELISAADTTDQEESPTALSAAGPSILVLPYGAVGEAAPVSRFSRGLSEVLLQNLQRFDGINVVDAQVASAAIANPLTTARELGADYVLRGSIMNDADSIRISSQLTSASTASILWSNSLVIPINFDSLLSVIDTTAANVAAVIAQPYGIVYRDQLASVPQQSPDALSSYLCLVIAYDYRANLTAARHALAEDCLVSTVDRDTDNAVAWAMLGLVYLDKIRLAFLRDDDVPDPMSEAAVAVREAVNLDPESALAQHALSEVLYFSGDLDAAFAAAERAIEINPGNADFLGVYAMRSAMTGHVDRAEEMLEAALAASPSPPGWLYFTPAFLNMLAGDFEQALASAERVAQPDVFNYQIVVGTAYGLAGRIEEAQFALDQAELMNPRFFDCPRGALAFRQFHPVLAERFIDGIRLSGRPIPAEEDEHSCPGV